MSGIGILAKLKGAISGKGPELVKNIFEGIDSLKTSDEERGVLDNKRAEIEAIIKEKVMLHEEKIQELALKETESYLADTQQARSTNVSIQESDKASWMAKNTMYILAGIVTIGFLSLLIYMLKYEVPEKNERIMDILLGSLGTAWITIINFFFGTSISSKTNGDIIRKIASK